MSNVMSEVGNELESGMINSCDEETTSFKGIREQFSIDNCKDTWVSIEVAAGWIGDPFDVLQLLADGKLAFLGKLSHQSDSAVEINVDSIRGYLGKGYSQFDDPIKHEMEVILSEDGSQLEVEPSEDFAKMIHTFERYESLRRRMDDGQTILKKNLAALTDPLLEQMGMLGMTGFKVGGLAMHTRTDKYVSKKKGVTSEDMCKVLEAEGFGELVKPSYSAMALKTALLTKVAEDNLAKQSGEMDSDDSSIPKAVRDKLQFGEVQKLVGVKK